MIYEFAVEPASFENASDARYLAALFGRGRGRLISRYPSSWLRAAYEAAQSTCRDVELSRVEVIIRELKATACFVSRPPDATFDHALAWAENAVCEHRRGGRPFRAIILRNCLSIKDDACIGLAELNERSNPLKVSTGRIVKRNAEALANLLLPMLLLARRVVFVDPYFDPATASRRRLVQELIDLLRRDRPNGPYPEIELVSAFKANDDHVKSHAPRFTIPEGMSFRLVRIEPRDASPKVHNRYVLTDVAGVQTGAGLDVARGDTHEDDDVCLLDDEQYETRWRQYGPERGNAFNTRIVWSHEASR